MSYSYPGFLIFVVSHHVVFSWSYSCPCFLDQEYRNIENPKGMETFQIEEISAKTNGLSAGPVQQVC